MTSANPWGDFTEDPRRPGTAHLRASDRDREVVLGVLGEAYADGRLTKEEYDERAAAATTARTLGELPALILDLVPQPVVSRTGLVLATPQELQSQAEARYAAKRRSALSGALTTSLVVTVIWLLLGGGFFWPGFVILACALDLLRVLTRKADLVAAERQRLERRQRKSLGPRGPGGS